MTRVSPSAWWGQGRRFVLLGAAPAILFVSAFFLGAYLPLPSMVLFALTSACLIAALTQAGARDQLAGLRFVVPIMALFGVVIGVGLWTLTRWTPGGVASLNTSATVLEMIRLCGLASLFVLGCIMGATAERARASIRGLLVLGGLYACASLLIFVSGGQIGHHPGRLLGGFYSANTAGTLLGVLSLLAAAMILRQLRRATRQSPARRIAELAPLMAIAGLFTACLLLTASRAALAATGVALVVLVVLEACQNRVSKRGLLALAAGFVAVVLILLATGNTLFVDRYQTSDIDAANRLILLQAHWRAFLTSPVFGFGLGSYPEVNNQILTPDNFGALSDTIVLHNTYLQWLEEAGVAGAVPMFLLIGWILGVTAWRAAGRRQNRTLLVGLLLASAVVLFHASVDVSLHSPTFTGLWSLLLGLGFALAQAPKDPRRSEVADA